MNVLQAMPDTDAGKDTFGMINLDVEHFFEHKVFCMKSAFENLER